VRGLDSEERYILDVITRRDYNAPMHSRAAVERCRARNLFVFVLDRCGACGDVHEMPVLTTEGRTAITCDTLARNLT
jgi:hypothetical protein